MKKALLLGVLTVAFAIGAGIAHGDDALVADEPPLTPEQHDLYLAVSRVCANEAFGHPADCMVVWQAVRRHGRTPSERLAWLRQHSRCVLGASAPVRALGNCPWTRNLTDSDRQPDGWPADWRWEPNASSRNGGHVATWARTRRLVRRMVLGGTPPRGWPCAQDPDSWAGRVTDAAHIQAHAGTRLALRCTDPVTHAPTLNEGFRYVRRPATVAVIVAPEDRPNYD